MKLPDETSPFEFTLHARREPSAVTERAAALYQRAGNAEGEGIFVSLPPLEAVLATARSAQERLQAGHCLPLDGVFFTVKDNIDVAGLPTSSNVPGYGRTPGLSAAAILAAEQAGAILIGKTTMDQFATGLNGTRTSGPLCRNAVNPDYIPGGSSSGSAVSVARGYCDFSLGSDTGGSGRVPAAANSIVGLKPSLGLVSSRGMVYCNRSFDCIPIFAKSARQAFRVLDALAGYDELDPYSREDADNIPLAAQPTVPERLAVLRETDLSFFGDDIAKVAYERNLRRLVDLGYEFKEVDFAPFREAGDMVFKSPLVAERLVDYGNFLDASPGAVVPSVRQAIDAGRQYSARQLYEVLHRLQTLKREARNTLRQCGALVVPTIPRLYTIAEMVADPIEKNNVMGTYTYFVNPLDLCAVSVPGYVRPDGMPSALSFVAKGGEDAVLRRLAEDFELT